MKTNPHSQIYMSFVNAHGALRNSSLHFVYLERKKKTKKKKPTKRKKKGNINL